MTRVAIDAKFFPHIIDEIFSHASASALLALRVNREWRERAERKVAYHVCVAQTVAETESLPRATPVLQAPEQVLLGILKPDSPESTAPTFLSFASVIDLQIPKLNKQVVPLLAHCSSDAIFRCHRLCHFATPANVTPKVRRVVLFATDSGPARIGRGHEYYSRFRFDHIPGQKHVVLHIRNGDCGGPQDFSDICKCFGKLGGMIIILHPWQFRRSFFPPTLERAMSLELSLLFHLVVIAYVKNAPVTVVNFDFNTFEKLQNSDPLNRSVKDILVAEIERTKGAYTSPPIATVYTPVRFLTVEEYRSEVGEELFQIATNEGRLWPPHLSPQ